MPDKRTLLKAIAILLLFNAIGLVLILLELREPDETGTTTAVIEAPDQKRPASTVEIDAETPAQVESAIDQPATDAEIPNSLPPDTAPTEAVIARVNGSDIGQTLLISYLNQLASPQQLAQWKTLNDVPQKLLAQSINNAALDKLLIQLAEQSKLNLNPTVRANIEQANRNILKTAFLNRLAAGLVNNKNVKTQYDALVASMEGKQEYRARHILLANEKEARIVDKALEEKNKTFDELAKLFSLDEPTSPRGGDLGYVLEGQLNPEFEAVINRLEIGQVSKPFKTELGWHIALVDDRRKAMPMSLEQSTPVIRRKLEQQAIQRYLAELLASADIEVLVSLEPAE